MYKQCSKLNRYGSRASVVVHIKQSHVKHLIDCNMVVGSRALIWEFQKPLNCWADRKVTATQIATLYNCECTKLYFKPWCKWVTPAEDHMRFLRAEATVCTGCLETRLLKDLEMPIPISTCPLSQQMRSSFVVCLIVRGWCCLFQKKNNVFVLKYSSAWTEL